MAAPKCDFAQGPDVSPVLDVSRSIQFCEGKIFNSIEAGKNCVLKNSKAEDAAGRCRPINTKVTSARGVGTCDYEITVSHEMFSPSLLHDGLV